jgi:hypothetical protein
MSRFSLFTKGTGGKNLHIRKAQREWKDKSKSKQKANRLSNPDSLLDP